MKKKIIFVAAVIVIAALFFAAPLASTRVSKPTLTTSAGEGVKPPLATISLENVNWLMNEVGAYKLNDGAQIETIIDGVVFTTSVSGHVPSTTAGTGDADLRFTVSSADFQQLYSSGDMIATAKQLRNENKLSIDILKSELVLYTKGYGALYDELK